MIFFVASPALGTFVSRKYNRIICSFHLYSKFLPLYCFWLIQMFFVLPPIASLKGDLAFIINAEIVFTALKKNLKRAKGVFGRFLGRAL